MLNWVQMLVDRIALHRHSSNTGDLLQSTCVSAACVCVHVSAAHTFRWPLLFKALSKTNRLNKSKCPMYNTFTLNMYRLADNPHETVRILFGGAGGMFILFVSCFLRRRGQLPYSLTSNRQIQTDRRPCRWTRPRAGQRTEKLHLAARG